MPQAIEDLNMKTFALILISLLLILMWNGCKDLGLSVVEETGITGQVYLISSPGPVPVNWSPPPFEQVSTIVVMNVQKNIVEQKQTSKTGEFMISLPAGTYYLRVKESPLPAETGPFEISSGRILTVQAHYDNGMR